MSVVSIFLNLIQKVVFVIFIIPTSFKIIEFVHNLIQTVEKLRDSLKAAEQNIIDLRETVNELKIQADDIQKNIQYHMAATADMQQQIIDQSIGNIETTKQIEEVYECLDLLDDRLLEIAKSEKTRKTKKQVRKYRRQTERQEIEALDRKLPNEEIFDQFVADVLVSDPGSQIGKGEIHRLFREWCGDNRAYTSNDELEEYMFSNFDWNEHAWTGIKCT